MPNLGISTSFQDEAVVPVATQREERAERTRRRKHRTSKRVLQWHKGRVIGQGGFGTVYCGLDANSGQLVAGKEFNFDVHEAKQVELLGVLEKEISTMRELTHPNIVKYIGADRVKNCFYIFMEYVAGGSLRALLDEFGALQLKVVSNFTRQIVLGLQYLHQNQVIHRDVKAANYEATMSVGNLTFGLWDALSEMLTGLRPFAQFDNPAKALNFIVSSTERVPLPEQCDRHAREFLNLCFARNARDRPSATQLLNHPFISQLIAEQSYNHSTLASFSASDRGFSASADLMTNQATSGVGEEEQRTSQDKVADSAASALADDMRSALIRAARSHSTLAINPLRSVSGHQLSVHQAVENKGDANQITLPAGEEGDILVVELEEGDVDDSESLVSEERPRSPNEVDDPSGRRRYFSGRA
ncbi:protein kinase, putative [Bodo saltans]|uniref:Protein kinase, putative n=1 Tax=Bodo saltans TaxID=75058 RepID=A0A0S4IQM8_BODSA|nr:protein kinase, putative [Bodo saltans]|eukprot:CUF97002.1 protein kinase, putative [Bodo saltans]